MREFISGESDGVKWRLALFAYRRLRHTVISKAIEYNTPILVVDPRNTSSTCPVCNSKPIYLHRLAIYKSCRFKRDRDTIGAVNTWLRVLQAPPQ